MVKVSLTLQCLRAIALSLIATACVVPPVQGPTGVTEKADPADTSTLQRSLTKPPVMATQGEALDWPTLSVMPPQGLGRDDAALIIGIEDYAFAPDVPGAVRNAEDWYQYFIKTRQVPIGSVKLLRDAEASLEMIEEAAEDVARRVRAGGTLWVVFIGHGAPQANGEDGVLIGMDAQQTARSLYSRSLPQKRLAALVEGGAQRHTVFILDACFSGKVGADQMFAEGLQPMILVKAPSSVTVLSAGASNEFAGPLPGIARPAFSYLLLGAMRGWADADADGAVTADEAIDYARVALQVTLKDRKQTPQVTGPQPPPLSKPASPEPGPDLAALVLGQRRAQPPAANATRAPSAATPAGGAVSTWAPVEMVAVPAGAFWMGCHASDSACEDDEKPGKQVYLDAFQIDKTEVTVAGYRACVDAGRCSKPDTIGQYCTGNNNNWNKSGRDQHPVNCVDWFQADTYCRSVGKQLPTEAQWEKAARGTDGRIYSWGNRAPSCDYAVMEDGSSGCGTHLTMAVASKAAGASPYGALDMAGNVWEWTANWNGGYTSSPSRNPTGPNSGSWRVRRGGAFLSFAAHLRASDRYFVAPNVAGFDLGFRCAAPASP